ncbi:MAG: (4Fe-4S)-binding protein [Bacteroidota bacterium]
MKKEYTNGEVTVVWKPGLCFHAKECVHGLPGVFKPNEKPWIQVENSDTEALKATIDKCPSGALSYYTNKDGSPSEEADSTTITRVEIMNPGPILIHGAIEITHANASTELKNRTTAFCRCGKTGNNPYCDGSHNIDS